MSNMSYCRFENTYNDLLECLDALDNEGGIEGVEEEANQYEKPYVRKLIELCDEVAQGYVNELEQ